MCAKRFPSEGPEAARRALADLVDRFGAGRVSIELTHHGHPLDDERNAILAGLAPRFGVGVGVVATTGAHFARAVATPAGHGDGRDPGPPVAGLGVRDGWPRWAVRTCGPVRRWPGCSRSDPTR